MGPMPLTDSEWAFILALREEKSLERDFQMYRVGKVDSCGAPCCSSPPASNKIFQHKLCARHKRKTSCGFMVTVFISN